MPNDRTAPVPSIPDAHSWDNTELRNRLAGHQVEDPSLAELQRLVRSRVDEPVEPSSRRRRRR
jgi:hypothetical protein